jgi:hypothetical protein
MNFFIMTCNVKVTRMNFFIITCNVKVTRKNFFITYTVKVTKMNFFVTCNVKVTRMNFFITYNENFPSTRWMFSCAFLGGQCIFYTKNLRNQQYDYCILVWVRDFKCMLSYLIVNNDSNPCLFYWIWLTVFLANRSKM